MFRNKYKSCTILLREKHTSVAECYEGQSAFITGGTGFVGKVLVEKLLYQCPGIEKIYLLLREKKNVAPHLRLQQTLDQPLFARLRNEKPQVLDKIVPIIGDIAKPGLAMRSEDQKLLLEKVTTVFHVAASVSFDSPLDVAMNINVAGVERVLNLCHQMTSLRAFLHVSTAYCNTDKKVIEEVVYPPPTSLDKVNEIVAKGIEKDQVKALIKKQPNTYAFAKAIAETMIVEKRGNIPTVIVRPTIVSASKDEPLVGWVDNWFGLTGMMTLTFLGTNRVLMCKSKNILDLIPVDYVTNLMIVAAAIKSSSNDNALSVYNCATSKENPINLTKLRKLVLDDCYKHKTYNVPYPYLHFTTSKWVEWLIVTTFNTIPAYLTDTLLLWQGKKPRYINFNSKVSRMRNVLEFFSSNSWEISAAKTRALAASLTPKDKQNFKFDPIGIDWNDYIPKYCRGVRRYMLKHDS